MSFLENRKIKIVLIVIVFAVIGFFVYYHFTNSNIEYNRDSINNEEKILGEDIEGQNLKENEVIPEIITPASHIETPSEVKAIYMSSWVASGTKYRDPLIKMIEETELNAVVIDIKDSTGKISFLIEDENIKNLGGAENRIRDIKEFIEELHKKNIYVIGRISVFQDPHLTKVKPEWAIKRKSDGAVWKDKKGLSFLDPTKKEVMDYTLSIALHSYEIGFDEINFDYIRYPSDGNMKDINYNLKEGETRSDNMEKFFKYLNEGMKKDKNIPISGDLFGLTTEAMDDMGIGQVWEKAIPYFDFLCPMVYPSHYPSGHMGYKNPSLYPYEVINQALVKGIVKTEAIGQNRAKIRPWLQDFDLGATYTKELVRAQMKATYDNNLTSWMLWDPSNKYTKDALLIEN